MLAKKLEFWLIDAFPGVVRRSARRNTDVTLILTRYSSEDISGVLAD